MFVVVELSDFSPASDGFTFVVCHSFEKSSDVSVHLSGVAKSAVGMTRGLTSPPFPERVIDNRIDVGESQPVLEEEMIQGESFGFELVADELADCSVKSSVLIFGLVGVEEGIQFTNLCVALDQVIVFEVCGDWGRSSTRRTKR